MEGAISSPSNTEDTYKKENEKLVLVSSVEAGQVSETFNSSSYRVSELQGADLDTAIKNAVNHRRLNPRQVQLTAIAGAIGATLFVAIGSGVLSGPLCMLIAFIFWATIVYSVAQCQTEIVTLLPLDGSFIRLAARMVDPALGVAVGWNHFFAQTSYIMFEATVINTIIGYWGYNQSPAILITVSLVLFLCINVYRADVFGESEFWIALCKVLLATGLILYTFITMLGGNPLHDRFGFRYWKDPGPWVGTNSSTRLESFVNAVNVASFCLSGPEYISIIAGEARDPRRTVLVPSNDKTLTGGAATYSGASPYVISMQRLRIPVLPSILTAVLITSCFSAGNAYVFNASRSLHAMALEGQAPKFLRRLNKKGVPYLAVIVVLLLSCLAYLALGSSSSQVLDWILNFCTAATMFNWCVMSLTWIRFNAAMKAQGIDRKAFLPCISKVQPFAGYWAFFWSFIFLWVQGYGVFLKGKWKISTFIFNYGIIALVVVIGLCWKLIKRTTFHQSKDVDLVSDLQFIEALTEHYQHEREVEPLTVKDKSIAKIF